MTLGVQDVLDSVKGCLTASFLTGPSRLSGLLHLDNRFPVTPGMLKGLALVCRVCNACTGCSVSAAFRSVDEEVCYVT